MKKTLIIARHAHAQDPIPGQPDNERTLSATGLRGAREAAEWLKAQGLVPDRIIASSAVRTQGTAGVFARVLFNDPERIEAGDALYRASETEVLDYINENLNEENTVLLVGHNPTASQLVIRLGSSNISYLPPASVVAFSFDINSWSELTFHTGKLLARYLPDEA